MLRRPAPLKRGDDAGDSSIAPSPPLPPLWPLLALPADLAESLLSNLLGDPDTKHALRLVSRAARDLVDGRVRSLQFEWFNFNDRNRELDMARFPCLEMLGVKIHTSMPAITRGLSSLASLTKLKLNVGGGPTADMSAHRAKVADLARELPPSLQELEIMLCSELPGAGAFFKAAAFLPALQLLKVQSIPAVPRESYAALHRTWRLDGAWATLRELLLSRVDAAGHAAIASATRLTALRKLELLECTSSGLHLLATAPWIPQLTELRLRAGGDNTDALFEGSLELPRLETLTVADFQLSPTGLPTAKMPALSSLELSDVILYAPCTAASLQAIAAAPWFLGLTELTLSRHDNSDSRALLSAPFRALSKLTALRLSKTDVEAIAASRPLHHSLGSLALSFGNGRRDRATAMASRVDVVGCEALARVPFEALRDLEITVDSAYECERVIRGTAWASQLTRLEFSVETYDDDEYDDEDEEEEEYYDDEEEDEYGGYYGGRRGWHRRRWW